MNIIIIVGLIAVLYYYFFVHTKKIFLKELMGGVSMVKGGIHDRLHSKFKNKYGDKEGGLLAAAVVNELFSELPTEDEAIRFENLNKDLIQQELLNLKNDVEIRSIITQAIRIKAVIDFAKGERTKATVAAVSIKKLLELGILMPGGESPTPKTFLPMAYKFYQSAKEEFFASQKIAQPYKIPKSIFVKMSDFDDSIAYYNRGLAYSNSGQHQKAVKEYTMAIKLNPILAESYSNRGRAYTKLVWCL